MDGAVQGEAGGLGFAGTGKGDLAPACSLLVAGVDELGLDEGAIGMEEGEEVVSVDGDRGSEVLDEEGARETRSVGWWRDGEARGGGGEGLEGLARGACGEVAGGDRGAARRALLWRRGDR
jgi:hypothetical protein